MKKFLTLLLIVIAASVLGAIYGILHDQLTYTISPEYYTKFKFHQFGLLDGSGTTQNPRLLAAVVGLMATWWMGYIIGFVLGVVAFIHKNPKTMFAVAIRAMFVTIAVAFATGLAGLAYGYYQIGSTDGLAYNIAQAGNIDDAHNFHMVGSMHNFSYLGGIIGLICGIAYIIRQKRNCRLNVMSNFIKI